MMPERTPLAFFRNSPADNASFNDAKDMPTLKSSIFGIKAPPGHA
jgi:hypothetical protein